MHPMNEGTNQEEREALPKRWWGSDRGGRFLGGESFLSLNEVQQAMTFCKYFKK